MNSQAPGRNIVLCFDGTSDEVDSTPSNVLRLFRTLVSSPGQLLYYEPGIGTLMDPELPSPWTKLARKGLDLASAFGLREKVIDGLAFLADNYRPGDRVFLFGFSRGSYTARAVAGALRMFGLVRPEHKNLLPYIWERFSDNEAAKDTPQSKAMFATAEIFKSTFAQPFEGIHFVGVFDTVSSFGFFGMYRTLPYTRSNPLISVLRHAVSIEEHRAHFPLNAAAPLDPTTQDYKVVWFAGVHDDVGGGQPDSQAALAKVALRWMMGEAMAKGLLFDPAKVAAILTNPVLNPLAPRSESLTWVWRLIGLLPLRTWSEQAKKFRWHWPNFSWLRPIDEGSLLHHSVEQRLKADPNYRPKNLPAQYGVAEDLPLSSE